MTDAALSNLALAMFFVAALSAVGVYLDARRRDWTFYGWSAGGWAAAVFFFWIIALPYYLWRAHNVPRFDRRPGTIR